METPNIVVIVVKRYAVREAEKKAVRSTQGQNRAVCSTQGGGGVTLINNKSHATELSMILPCYSHLRWFNTFLFSYKLIISARFCF